MYSTDSRKSEGRKAEEEEVNINWSSWSDFEVVRSTSKRTANMKQRRARKDA